MQNLIILNTRILSWKDYVQAGGGKLYKPGMFANPDNPGLTLETLGQPLTIVYFFLYDECRITEKNRINNLRQFVLFVKFVKNFIDNNFVTRVEKINFDFIDDAVFSIKFQKNSHLIFL